MTIRLTPELESLIEQRAKKLGVDTESFAAQLLEQALSDDAERRGAEPRSPERRTSISQRFEAIRQTLSKEEQQALDDLPEDFAAEHDHYIYGSPKRSQ